MPNRMPTHSLEEIRKFREENTKENLCTPLIRKVTETFLQMVEKQQTHLTNNQPHLVVEQKIQKSSTKLYSSKFLKVQPIYKRV